MTKFAFHSGDIVREKAGEKPVTGKVIGFGRGGGANWYRIASRGETYNAREDELELVKAKRLPVWDSWTLDWYTLDMRKPEEGEECLVVYRSMKIENGPVWVRIGYWGIPDVDEAGELTKTDGFDVADIGPVLPDDVVCWAAWEWPDLPEDLDLPEGGGEHDESSDLDG